MTYTVEQQVEAIRSMVFHYGVKGFTTCTAQCEDCTNYDCPIVGVPRLDCPNRMGGDNV